MKRLLLIALTVTLLCFCPKVDLDSAKASEIETVFINSLKHNYINQFNYTLGMFHESSGNYVHAAICYKKAGHYKDALEKAEILEYYQNAEQMLASKEYMKAREYYIKCSGYKDSESKIIDCNNALIEISNRRTKLTTVGQFIELGHYEQDNNTENGEETIEWQILAVSNNDVLVISRYGLDSCYYNTDGDICSWENCTLRAWLNSTFINNAFTIEEQQAIKTAKIDNSNNQCCINWTSQDENNTYDKIFILSYAEVSQYFNVTSNSSNNTNIRIQPTAYAINHGAYTNKGTGWWWIRSPGYNPFSLSFTFTTGLYNLYNINPSSGCVRPALWVNLKSSIFQSYILNGIY